jgi:hypothetical protein
MPKYKHNKIIRVSLKFDEGIQPARESKHADVTRHPSKFNRASFCNPGMNQDNIEIGRKITTEQ